MTKTILMALAIAACTHNHPSAPSPAIADAGQGLAQADDGLTYADESASFTLSPQNKPMPDLDIIVNDEHGHRLLTDPGGSNRVCDVSCVPGGSGWGPAVVAHVATCLRGCMALAGVKEP